MRLKSIALLVVAVVASGCSPQWARNSQSDVLMFIESVSGTSGGAGSSSGTPFLSDVADENGGVFNDNASLVVRLITKNPLLANPGQVNDVILRRYTVRYFRTDGRNVAGVDVPYSISGEMTARVSVGGTTTASLIIVRHAAKLEAPLKNMQSLNTGLSTAGMQFVMMQAEITVYGQTLSGDTVSAVGYLEIMFGDFA